VSRTDELAAALADLTERLARACRSAGRDPGTVALLPVTKFFPASDVRLLYDLGCREFGESRVQEATAKAAEMDLPGVRWHMIGQVQRNKARVVAGWAHAVHSVDTPRLVRALAGAARAALDAGERRAALRVFIQVSLDGDPARGGIPATALAALADEVAADAALELAGLMAIPPLGASPDAAFAQLAELHARLLRAHPRARELSAGMSTDLEQAIAHGSTCVRVGTALLGSRPLISEQTSLVTSDTDGAGGHRETPGQLEERREL